MLTPRDLGFPESFSEFRDCQHEAFEFVLTSEKRFCALGIPPGGGKSGVAYGLAKLLGGRTTILTATHGLEDQYVQTFNTTDRGRISHIRGRRNYECWEGGNCDDGRRLGCADKLDCPYLGAFRVYNAEDIGITNYAYWLAANSLGDGVLKPDTLICDEAGLADDWLSNHLNFKLTERDSRSARLNFGRPSEDIQDWVRIAPDVLQRAYDNLVQVREGMRGQKWRSSGDVARLRRAEEIYDAANKLNGLARCEDNWICTKYEGENEGRVWKFQCVWPGLYRERLFQGVQRVILMSATLRPYTLKLLGIPRAECEFKEWGRQFPAVNGPVIYIPTVKVRHDEKMSNEDRQRWIDRHDEIFTWGNDRRGLSHTVSYARARQINDALGTVHRLVLNGAADPESATATEAFRKFEQDPTNPVLVSPSFSTGWDFSGRLAEWQVISKLPLIPPTDKLIAARTDQDSQYPWYKAGQDCAQSLGRINRSYDDRGMTLIVDNQWEWFKRAAGDHMPKSIVGHVRREEQLPKPLDKL